ncbi:MAG: hypothetical protein GY842_25835 [bacterium]|nr:hypothetical protein [bacterium]
MTDTTVRNTWQTAEPADAAVHYAPGRGDGATTNDIQNADLGTDDREVRLRAERTGDGPGRIYTLTYQATDHVGNSVEAIAWRKA